MRSRRSSPRRTGSIKRQNTPAPSQSRCQSMCRLSQTNVRGSVASPKENPSAAIARARPLVATNHRAIATTETVLVMPCPKNRSARITKGSPAAHGLSAIAKQANPKSPTTSVPKKRTRNLSVSPPANSIRTAEAPVPSVYIPPHSPLLSPKAARISPPKMEMKKVCPNEDRNDKRTPAKRKGAFSRRKRRKGIEGIPFGSALYDAGCAPDQP